MAVCDCFPELQSVTDAREARYRADPTKRAPEGPQSSLEIKVTSVGNLNERVETRNSNQTFVISEPKHVGGVRRRRWNICSPARSAVTPRCLRSTRRSWASITRASRRWRGRTSTCAAT